MITQAIEVSYYQVAPTAQADTGAGAGIPLQRIDAHAASVIGNAGHYIMQAATSPSTSAGAPSQWTPDFLTLVFALVLSLGLRTAAHFSSGEAQPFGQPNS